MMTFSRSLQNWQMSFTVHQHRPERGASGLKRIKKQGPKNIYSQNAKCTPINEART